MTFPRLRAVGALVLCLRAADGFAAPRDRLAAGFTAPRGRAAAGVALRAVASDAALAARAAAEIEVEQMRADARARRAAAAAEAREESEAWLRSCARSFIEMKNAGDLDSIFAILAPDANVYGLSGEAIVPGLTAYFQEHRQLHHEIIGEPRIVDERTVDYVFVKSWTDDAGDHVWKSLDADRDPPRNKVERLSYNVQGELQAVNVQADEPV
ncbi:hypothetical protein M885DRAFT_504981 [Pelagophyceae sp. CCMP2097]|nr:hypothetical protein M885DRAFT_504981 [Pelagophyceae sp. CCMP2097]